MSKRTYCKRHKRYFKHECVNCFVDRKLAEREAGIETSGPRVEELAPEKPEKKRIGYPCQHGEPCEWATHNGKNITCSRLLGGCAKE